MSVANRRRTDLTTTSLANLSISSPPASKSKTTKPIADSWDDETSDSETETASFPSAGLATTSGSTGSSAPPPTPLTPTLAGSAGASSSSGGGAAYGGGYSFDSPYAISSSSKEPLTPMRGHFRPDSRSATGTDGKLGGEPEKRPEKTAAAAARMIAAGLGVRAPKKTEDMKVYERSIREREEKRLREEKGEKQRLEDAKRAAWED